MNLRVDVKEAVATHKLRCNNKNCKVFFDNQLLEDGVYVTEQSEVDMHARCGKTWKISRILE